MTMFLDIFPDLLRGTTTTISILLLLPILSKTKLDPKRHSLIVITITLIDLIICTQFYLNENYTSVLYYSLLTYVLIIVGFEFILKDPLFQWLFNSVTVLIIYAMIVISSYFLSQLFTYPQYAVTIIRLVMFIVTIVVFKRIVRPLYLDVSENWGAFLLPITGILVSYLYILLSLGEVTSSMRANAIYFYLLCFITICVYIAIIVSLKSLRGQYQLREDNIKRQSNELLLRGEIQAYESSLNAAKQTRHDIRHHNTILLEYLQRGDIDEAKHYLKVYDDKIQEIAVKDYSKNPMTNAVFRIYGRRTKEFHIDFKVHAEADNQLYGRLPDIGIVLSNLLENAFTAAKSCMFEDRYISYKSCIDQDSLLIEIRNSTEQEVGFEHGLPKSTKKDGGTGLKSVKYLVEQQAGMIEFKQDKNTFITRIIFPMTV